MRNLAPLLRLLALSTLGVALAGAPLAQQGGGRGDSAAAADAEPTKKAKKQKPGIPVDDVLVQSLCGRCHTRDDREHMTRISYVRKSPEGWAQTIKRMGRLHGLQLSLLLRLLGLWLSHLLGWLLLLLLSSCGTQYPKDPRTLQTIMINLRGQPSPTEDENHLAPAAGCG